MEEPVAETQARAEDALINVLDQRQPPSPEIEELCQRIREVIGSKRPPDEDSLVEADPEEMARQAGGQLNEAIESDTNRVQSSYNELQSPPQGQPAQQPQAIEPPPASVEAPPVDAQTAVPEPVPAENISLEADVEANQQRMDEAGMNSESAQLVRTGPIAEARAAQGELEGMAERDPAEVLAEQVAAQDRASIDMAALEQRALQALATARATSVTQTDTGQQNMVGTEEQMRARVGADAQRIFQTAQTQVNNLLEPLSRTAMSQWDTGVAVLSERFKQRLHQVKAWIDERYSGAGGAIVEVVESVVGLPDWVTEEYDAAERDFGDGVCDLIRDISSHVNGVIATCEGLIEGARSEITDLFTNLPVELQDWAAGEQARFGEQLDGLHNQATQTRDSFNQDLSRRASQSVQEVRQQIHTLREAAGGLIGRIVNAVDRFLEDPTKFIIEGLLELVGIPPASFWALVNRIQQVIADIADNPLGFANNLVAALGQGFQKFFDNFSQHILGGFFEWLFSGLGAVGVQIPADFSLNSLITFFLQLMGITWARIRGVLARHIGEENVALLEKAYELIAALMERGVDGIFELIKEQLNPQAMLDAVLRAAVDFMIDTLIRAVTPRIIGLFNPAGAIVQAIEVIYRVLSWIFENAARIFTLVETVVNGTADLIAGNIGGMATAIEGALARILGPVIDFLAGFLGLGDLPDRIADTIRGFQEMVLGVIDRVVAWLAERARGLLRALGIGADAQDQVNEEDPEKAERVRVGLAAIDTEEQKVIEAGKISHDEAIRIAATVKRDHPIFTQLEVVDGGDSWNYHWEASPGDTKETSAEKEEGPTPDPNRVPQILPTIDGYEALDPAADETNNRAGFASWKHGDGYVTLAIYPKDVLIGGQKPAEGSRLRGPPILTGLVNAIQAYLQEAAKGILAPLPYISSAAMRQTLENQAATYQIKGVSGVWGGDSTNLQEFNAAYKTGLSLEESAKATWTGRKVGPLYKYTTVSDITTSPAPDDPSVEERRELGFEHVSCVFS